MVWGDCSLYTRLEVMRAETSLGQRPDFHGLDEETRVLITALATINGHIPKVVSMLSRNELPVAKQLELADLLTSLGDLLREHTAIRDQARIHHRSP